MRSHEPEFSSTKLCVVGARGLLDRSSLSAFSRYRKTHLSTPRAIRRQPLARVVDRLIELARPTGDVTHVTFRCFGDTYEESLPLPVAREPRSLLAYGIGGKTLPLTHGFPLRLVVPRLFGYKCAKWVKQIEFTNAAVDGYWEQRGYSAEAMVQALRLRDGKY